MHFSATANRERTIMQAIINDDSSYKAYGKRNYASFNDKDLRDAAHAEVALGGDEVVVGKFPRKRKVFNADERAQQSRDRNREHAKNTRLRKKAYVYKLKELVDHMMLAKDSDVGERKVMADSLESEQHSKRTIALNFLQYRSNNTRLKSKWSEVAHDDVTFCIPITPYRYFPKSEVSDGTRTLRGHEALVIDSASIHLMMESIGHGSKQWIEWARWESFPRLTYESSNADVVSAGDTVVCRFLMTISQSPVSPNNQNSHNTNNGNPNLSNVLMTQPGMLFCKFDSDNRVKSAEMVYDVMNFINQLQRLSGSSSTDTIVPNTVQMALMESTEARAILSSRPPYPVLMVNNEWATQTGYAQVDAEGREFLKYFELGGSESTQILGLIRACAGSIPGRLIVHSSTSKLALMGRIESYYMKMLPLASETGMNSHILVVLQRLDSG
jgi:hypothetical protein